MKVTIKKTGINGEGIGYIDRMPVFVPQALIGEEVEIRIVDKQKRYATAELLRVVKSSNRTRDTNSTTDLMRIDHLGTSTLSWEALISRKEKMLLLAR